MMRGLGRSLSFLVKGPFILAICFLVSWMTDGDWFKWAALGIGIAWFVSLFRVLRAALVLGGIGAVAAYVSRQR
jgi:hypothetical protein